MRVIAVGTDSSLVARLENSCRLYGVVLTVLGTGEGWTGFGCKYRWVREHLRARPGPDDEIVVVLDGYDCLCQAEPSRIEEVCRRLCGGDTILVSTEIYSWPPEVEHLAQDFEKLAGHRTSKPNLVPSNVYPCAGQWAGTRSAVLRLVDRIHAGGTDDFDDQGVLSRDILTFPAFYVMDYDCEVFQANIYYKTVKGTASFNRTLSVLRDRKGRFALQQSAKGTLPCFLHCNGMGPDQLDVMESDHIAPLRRLWDLPTDRLPPMPVVRAITLRHRRPHIEAFADTERWPLAVFPARTSTAVSLPWAMTTGETLCYLSHEALVTQHLEEGSGEDLLVLEDDVGVASVVTRTTSRELVSDQWRRFRASDYDILLLGRCADKCDLAKPSRIPDSPDLLEPGAMGCTHAYLVRWTSIPKLLFLMKNTPREPYDDMIAHGWANGDLSLVASNPPVLNQMGLPAAIGGRAHITLGEERQSVTCSRQPFVIQDYVELGLNKHHNGDTPADVDFNVQSHRQRWRGFWVASAWVLCWLSLVALVLLICLAISSARPTPPGPGAP